MAYVRMNPTRIWESLQPKLWTWQGQIQYHCAYYKYAVKNGMITKPTAAKQIPIPEPADSFSGPSKSSWPAQSLQRPWPGIKPGQLSGTASPVAVAARCPKHSKRPWGLEGARLMQGARQLWDVEARSEDPGLHYPGVAADDGCQDRSFFVHCQIPISGLDFLLVGSMGKHGKTFFEIPNTHAISIGFPMFSRGFPAGCLMMSGFKRSIAMMIAKSHGKSRLVAIGQLGNWMPLVNL